MSNANNTYLIGTNALDDELTYTMKESSRVCSYYLENEEEAEIPVLPSEIILPSKCQVWLCVSYVCAVIVLNNPRAAYANNTYLIGTNALDDELTYTMKESSRVKCQVWLCVSYVCAVIVRDLTITVQIRNDIFSVLHLEELGFQLLLPWNDRQQGIEQPACGLCE